MKMSDRGIDALTMFEGFSNKIYDDGAGFLTIGYGHMLLENEKRDGRYRNGISEALARELLRKDLGFAERGVENAVRVPLKQHQFDALVSFTFNVGAGAFKSSTLVRRLNANAYDEVPEQLMRWVKAGGRTLRGLVTRRKAEGAMFRGDYPGRDLHDSFVVDETDWIA